MTSDVKAVFARQDEALMLQVAREVVDIPSPTGGEGPLAAHVASRFARLGFDVELQDVEPGRPNVVARWRTARPGPTLMLLAHLDVNTHPEIDALHPDMEVPRGFRWGSIVEDGWIYGNGVANMKGAFAAFYSAIQMLRDAKADLAGEIVMAGVVGEIEKAPIDWWQGKDFRGGGVGARALVHRGVSADFVINGEPTALRLQNGNAGYVFARIHLAGIRQATYSRDQAVDPFPQAFRVRQALLDWEREYQERHPHPRMRPLINVGAIYGGYPFKPSVTPSFCNLYVHVNTVPGQDPPGVKAELDDLLARCKAEDPTLDASVQIYLARTGHETPYEHPGVKAVAAAHEDVFGVPAPHPNPERYSVSSDNTILAEVGIEGVTYGAGGFTKEGKYAGYEPGGGPVGVKIERMAACARVYAASALRLLRPGASVVPPPAATARRR